MLDYLKLMDEIGISDSERELFCALEAKRTDPAFEAAIAEGRRAFREGNESFEAFILNFADREGLEPERIQLYLTLLYSDTPYEKFRSRGMDDSVFYEMMKDVTDKCEANLTVGGIYGLPVPEIPWFRYHLSGILFRLGRFQYQIAKSEYDLELDGYRISKGDTCFFVHVPGGEPLVPEVCERSYREAQSFFKQYFGADVMFCFCYSWLLQPWLADVLSESSNIMRFSRTYRLIETIESIPHTFRFIFPKQHDCLDDYPTDNPLRREAISRRRRGEPVGYGVGVRLLANL